ISGRVIDKTTGQVVPAIIFIGVLADNPFVKEYSGWNRQEVSENDGTFRIVAIPGPVVLMGAPDSRRLPGGVLESMKYKLAVPDPQYPQYFVRRFGAWHYRTERGGAAFVQGNFCKVIEIKPGTATVHEDIFLEQATNAIRVRIQDAEGHPLNGAWVTGISPKEWTSPIRIEEASCFAYEVAAAKPRLMVFYAPDKNLVGTLRLQGGEKQPVVVKLGPAGSVKGRLVSQEGRPVPGFVIRAAYPALEASEISRRIDGAKQPIVTVAEGAFRIDGLIPGVDFSLYHYPSGSSPQRSTALAEKLSVHPGETRMLGDLRSKPESPE
ncbi:MAG TPA: hypothetical protein VKU02_31305, partial [Gemmataceae bacterium]|nr:hypothetical protein [Gemmataceae bacterium]